MESKDAIAASIEAMFVGLLTTTFAVLKLCGVISWSWWWVFSPIWITCALFVLTIIIAVIVLILASRRNKRHD